MSLNTTQILILKALESASKPQSITQIAAAMDIHAQTARNHIMIMKEKGLIEVVAKDGKANLYQPTLGNIKGASQMMWKGNATPLIELINSWASDFESQFPLRNQTYRKIANAVVKLYKLALRSAGAYEETGVRIPSIVELRSIRTALIEELNQQKAAITSLESLINNDSLWQPNPMTGELIVNEITYSPLEIKMMIEQIEEEAKRMKGNN